MKAIDNSLASAKLSGEHLQDILTASRDCRWIERRSRPRHPCFLAATLHALESPNVQTSVYTREVSRSGLGLLHYVRLDVGMIYQINWSRGELPDGLRVEVVWCRPAGDGWYTSGCRFVS